MNKEINGGGRSEENSHNRSLARLWWLLPLTWMGVIFLLSAQPDLRLSPELWWDDLASWAAHFVEYAILAVLLWLAARRTPALARHAVLLAFILASLFALSDEFHQWFVPNRAADWRDVLVDFAGAAMALFGVSKTLARGGDRHATH